MTEPYSDLGGRPSTAERARSQQLHGCPENCQQNHTHAHMHPGGHWCRWDYGECGYRPEREV